MSADAAAGLRQSFARLSPAFVRKSVRMAEHYGRRQRDWFRLLRAAHGHGAADRMALAASAAAAPLTALRHLDGYGSPVLLRDIRIEVADVGTFVLRRGTDDPIHVIREREPHVWAVLRERLGAGDTFVDAGANIGFYSLRAARLVGKGGKVVAIEMMPQTAASLRRNLQASGVRNVSVVERALAARNGDLVEASADPAKLGQASIAFGSDGARSLTVEVETARLDTLIPDGRVALLKMDLEGAEYDALVGAERLLGRIGAIVFESNGEDRRIIDLLTARGFSVRHLADHDYLATNEHAR